MFIDHEDLHMIGEGCEDEQCLDCYGYPDEEALMPPKWDLEYGTYLVSVEEYERFVRERKEREARYNNPWFPYPPAA